VTGRAARSLLLCLAVSLLLGIDRPPGLSDVTEVRHWSYPTYTRVVVELTRPVTTEIKSLGADRSEGRPERLYLDLPGVWVGLRYADPIPVGDGLLEGIRLGQNSRTSARLVIDLKRHDHHRLFFLSSPSRVVVDVYGGKRSGRGAPDPGARRPSPGNGQLPLGMRQVHTVVLDPGHGGRDPGALGAYGLREKDVTLRLARELRPRLVGRGFRVVMTRDEDRTVSLEERTAFAEGVGGDVFISLHTNASRRRSARGIETYYLDKSHERHSRRVAARENGVPANRLDDLQRIVAQLRVSEVSVHSARLAKTVHEEIVEGVRSTHGSVEDLGVKRGPFYVLFLSNMPSILLEAGFLTNGAEAVRLRSDFYIDVLAEQISRGLSSYRRESTLTVAGVRR
jgi:N-acetylmuramoyl-L-alanine amidase